MTEERIGRELEFHNQRFGSETDPRQSVGKWYHALADAFVDYNATIKRFSKDKTVLEYGCGLSYFSDEYISIIKNCKQFTGIDISDVAIKKSNLEAAKFNLNNCEFIAMNAEATNFSGESFDLVYGSGIIHHLDVTRSFTEIARILKKDGIAVFIEPLGHNFLINKFRKKTPELRTPDEHPLVMSDFETAKEYFSGVQLSFFGLTTVGAVLFLNTKLYSSINSICKKIDSMLFKSSFFRKNAWMAVIILKK